MSTEDDDPTAFDDALRQLADDLRHGRRNWADSTSRLDELLAVSYRADTLQLLQAFAVEAGIDLVTECLRDSDPFRIGAMGDFAWRCARWGSADSAAGIALWIGYRLWSLESHETALRHLERAAAYEGSGRPGSRAVAETLRSNSLGALARYADGDALFEGACELAHLEGIPEALVLLHLDGARAASFLGRHTEAEERIKKAIELHGDSGAVSGEDLGILIPRVRPSQLYRMWGDAVRRGGDYQRAIVIYEQGRQHAFEDDDPTGAAWCLSEIGITWQQIGEAQRAEEYLDRAADEAAALGDDVAALRWRNRVPADPAKRTFLTGFNRLAYANALLIGHEDHSKEAERAALAIIAEARGRNPQLECSARNLLAECYRRRGAHAQAIAAIRIAIRQAESADEKLFAIRFRTVLATLYFQNRDFLQAEKAADETVAACELLWAEATTSELRQSLSAGLVSAYEILLVLAGEELMRKPDPARVTALAQRARSRNLNWWLALTNWGLEQSVPQWRQSVRQLLAAEMLVETSTYSGAPLMDAVQARDRAAASLLSVAKNATAGAPAKAPDPALEEVSQHLPAGSVAIDLNAVESGIVCTLVFPDRAPESFRVHWERADRRTWTERWNEALRRDIDAALPPGMARSAWRMAAELPSPSGTAAPALADVCDEVRRRLFEPILQRIGDARRRFFLTPHAELHNLPFWQLAGTPDDGCISFLPSLTSLVLLAQRVPSTGRVDFKVGDATSTLTLVSLELEHLHQFVTVPPHVTSLADTLHLARRIHFSGHGQFDSGNPYASGIILAGAEDRPLALPTSFAGCVRLSIPGMLRMLDLPECELAVMSACSTGVPRTHAASEFTSVPTALMLGGARNVIAAAWPAHDGATALLMQAFYAALEETSSVARALASARRSLRELDREDAIERLGSAEFVPDGQRPFDAPLYSDVFQHYGVS